MAIRLEGFEDPCFKITVKWSPTFGEQMPPRCLSFLGPPICKNIPGSFVAWQVPRALIGLGTTLPPRSAMGAGAELKILPITAGRQRKANGKR